jgi:hypothetical protein
MGERKKEEEDEDVNVIRWSEVHAKQKAVISLMPLTPWEGAGRRMKENR